MTSSTSSTSAAGWRQLFSLSRKEADDQQVLEAQLTAWCESHGVDAALYCPENGAPARRLKVGAAAFPDALPETVPEDWRRLELPSAVLLYTATDAAVDPQDPRLLLLAAGVRISHLKREIHQQSFQAKFRGVELEALYEMGLAIASTLAHRGRLRQERARHGATKPQCGRSRSPRHCPTARHLAR